MWTRCEHKSPENWTTFVIKLGSDSSSAVEVFQMKWMRVESGLGENMVQFVVLYSALSVYWQYMTKIAHFIYSEIFHFAAAVHGKITTFRFFARPVL